MVCNYKKTEPLGSQYESDNERKAITHQEVEYALSEHFKSDAHVSVVFEPV